MKVLSVLLTLVLVVTVLAVNGSRAQPLPGMSTALQQCLWGEAAPAGRCVPIATLRAGFDDIGGDRPGDLANDAGWSFAGDYGDSQGDNAATPEFLAAAVHFVVKELSRALAAEFATRVADRVFGGNADRPAEEFLSATLFDPVR